MADARRCQRPRAAGIWEVKIFHAVCVRDERKALPAIEVALREHLAVSARAVPTVFAIWISELVGKTGVPDFLN